MEEFGRDNYMRLFSKIPQESSAEALGITIKGVHLTGFKTSCSLNMQHHASMEMRKLIWKNVI